MERSSVPAEGMRCSPARSLKNVRFWEREKSDARGGRPLQPGWSVVIVGGLRPLGQGLVPRRLSFAPMGEALSWLGPIVVPANEA